MLRKAEKTDGFRCYFRRYIERGRLHYDFAGLVKAEGVWYYILNGRWQPNYRGLTGYSTGSRMERSKLWDYRFCKKVPAYYVRQ